MRQRGHTLLEVTIVLIVMALLAAAGVPTYRRMEEQARVDTCAATLRSVWSAQRAHWLEAREYASSFQILEDERLLERGAVSGWDAFSFHLASASASAFSVTATRSGGVWTGILGVDEKCEVHGVTSDAGGNHVVPSSR